MSGEQLKELLQSARQAENSGDKERAGELYQQIVDEHPHSRAAKIAGERLIKLEDEGTPIPESSTDPADSPGESTNDREADAATSADRSPDASAESSGELACPQCGGTAFVHGDLEGKQHLKFDPDDDKLLSFDSVWVRARVCKTCGNLQPYVENPESVG